MDTDVIEKRREKAREYYRKRIADPEYRARLTALARNRRDDPEVRAHQNALARKQRECRSDPKVRAHQNAKQRERYAADPEYRERLNAKQRTRRSDPEVRERLNAKQRERYTSDPEYRAYISAKQRERYASDSEYRRKELEISKQSRETLQTIREFLRKLGYTETLSVRDLRAARRLINHVHAGGELPSTDESLPLLSEHRS